MTDTMKLFLKTKYCLAPPGDSVTRKSLFDALLSGCVPVLNARASLTQYSWYLSRDEVDEVSVYIPSRTVLSSANRTNFMDVLLSIPESELRRKQIKIAQIASRLQYSVVPSRFIRNAALRPYRPQVRDAVDVMLEHALDRRTVEPMSGFSVYQLKEMFMRSKYIAHFNEDYTGRVTAPVDPNHSPNSTIPRDMKGRENIFYIDDLWDPSRVNSAQGKTVWT